MRAVDVVVLIALSLLAGALAATYLVYAPATRGIGGAGVGSGLLGCFAVGCPVCNKLVVALLGASGASGVFAPIQPALGGAAVVLAGGVLVVRLRATRLASCALPSSPPQRSDRPATGPGLGPVPE